MRRRAWQPIYTLTATFVAIYVTWHLFPSLPYGRSSLASLLECPLSFVAAGAAWFASRRSRASSRLRRAWFLLALGLIGQGAGSVIETAADLGRFDLAYPSLADAFYLAFYPLALLGVLSFPALRRSPRQTLEFVLDCAIVGFGAAAAFGYLVLGPSVLEGASPLEAAVTIAYPVGDMILIVALAASALRSPMPAVRTSLRWLTAAIGLLVLGDLVWGYEVLHGNYGADSLLNIAYVLSTACFVVAATQQRPAVDEPPPRELISSSRNSWLPFAAIATAMAIFLRVDLGNPFFPDVFVGVATAAVMALVVSRQLVSLADLRQSRAHLTEAQEIAQLGSWEWDIAEDRIELSEEGARLLGLAPGSLLGLDETLALVDPDDRAAFLHALEKARGDHRPFTVETRLRRSDGEFRSFLSRADVAVKNGVATRLQGTLQDITDRKRMEAQLEYQADHDPLTGLFNRRRFAEELERALRFVNRYGRRGAVLMIDVDHFKTVNDTHGHATGDRILKGVAAAIDSRARETDVVARLGGDEFSMVLPEATTAEAEEVAGEIRRAAAKTEGAPKLSVGIGPFEAGTEMVADDILVAADMALYEAKDLGRDRIAVYSGKTNGPMSWVERIRDALEEDTLLLYAQPMIDVASGEVSHKELLVRMLSEDGDVIPPEDFLPTAERVGLSTEIDRWVTRNGLDLARRGERVAINLSAPSIGDAQIMGMVRDAVADGVEPSHLIFEITETAAMSNMPAARAFVEELTDIGCGVALDDFGTGFGSFIYLKHLPTSHLKIDMEFVRNLLENATDREVVKSITEVAHSLGKQTVAEGVEDRATLSVLRDYGVDCAQGFFIGRPEPVVVANVEAQAGTG